MRARIAFRRATKALAMTPDPMDDLRRVDQPVAPRREFTAELRARIERELGPIPPGGAMATTTAEPTNAPAPDTHLRTITPYLAVSDARAAMAWYQDIFGATLASEPIVMPDGRIGHVELRIGDAVLMMADEFADIDVLGPTSRGGTTVSFVIDVPDVDTTYARAVAAGAISERPPSTSTAPGPAGSATRGAIAGASRHHWRRFRAGWRSGISVPPPAPRSASARGPSRRPRPRWPTSATSRSACPTSSGPPPSTRPCSAGIRSAAPPTTTRPKTSVTR